MNVLAETPSLESRIEESLEKPTILVVDDDPGVRELIKFKFRDKYEVVTVSSSEEAEIQLEKRNFELMLLDIGLPGEDGLRFRKRTKEKYDVPTIFFTGLNQEDLQNKSLELGAFDYIQKPIKVKELLFKINNIVKKLNVDKLHYWLSIVHPNYIAKSNGGPSKDPRFYKIVSVSDSFKEDFGIDPSLIKGKTHSEMLTLLGLSEEDKERFYNTLIKKGGVKGEEFYSRKFFLDISSTFPKGNRLEIQGQIRNVTEKKKLEIKDRVNALTNEQLINLARSIDTLDLEQIINESFKRTQDIFGAELCSIFLFNYELNKMIETIKRGKPTVVIEEKDFEEIGVLPQEKYKGMRFVTIPLRIGKYDENKKGTSELVGIINLTKINLNKIFEGLGYPSKLFEKLEFKDIVKTNLKYKAEMLAGIIGTKISNAQHHTELRKLADTDYLTSLYIHRKFQEDFEKEFKRCVRYNSPFSLLLIDVDHFKKVNDAYGHQVGDKVLRTLSAIIKDSVRNTDSCYRYGGEELAVILPNTDTEGAYNLAERIRRKIEKFTSLNKKLPNITVSIGVNSYLNNFTSKQEFFESVDKALYRAKASGRNRVVRFDELQNYSLVSKITGWFKRLKRYKA